MSDLNRELRKDPDVNECYLLLAKAYDMYCEMDKKQIEAIEILMDAYDKEKESKP